MAKTLIIGGTRFLGPKIIDLLLKRGHEVTIFNRGNSYGPEIPEEVEIIKGDRTKSDDLQVIKNRNFDYVYDMCCYDKDDADKLLKVVDPNAHLIFLSTAAVYKKPSVYPIVESSSLGEWSSFGAYGTNKAEAEAAFARFAERHDSKLTIFRPTYLLGEDNYFDRENYYFSRLKQGSPILVPGNGTALIQFAFLEETAEAFVSVPISQNQQIEILNIGGDQYVTVKGVVELCAKIAGCEANIVQLEPARYDLEEEAFYDDLYPFPNLNFIASNEAIKSRYGTEFEPLEQGLHRLYNAWLKNWDGKVDIYPKETAILKQVKK